MPIDLLPLNFLLLILVVLGLSACDRLQSKPARSSVTVKLPPARAPKPGFDFNRPDPKR